MYKIQDYVVLKFSFNSPYLEAEELNLRRLPPGMVAVDTVKMEWTWQDHIERETQLLKFGQIRRLPMNGSRWGTVGIFDKTELKHLNTMLRFAGECAQPHSRVDD